MYLLCYGRSDKAEKTIKSILSGNAGKRIGSTEFFASDISSPDGDQVCLVMVLPLEAACSILSRNLSSDLSGVPVICASPDGKFVAALRYGSALPSDMTAAVSSIARSLGGSCFTDFGSIADIAKDLSVVTESVPVTISDKDLYDKVNAHIKSGGRVSIYSDLPLTFEEPVLDSMVFELHKYSQEMHEDFIQKYTERDSSSEGNPSVFITCRKLPGGGKGKALVLTPKLVCIGIELKSKTDPQYAADTVRSSLENHLIDPRAVSVVAVSQSASQSEAIRAVSDMLEVPVVFYEGRELANVRLPLKMTFAPEHESDTATSAAYLASSGGKILFRRSGGASGVIFSAALRKGNISMTD